MADEQTPSARELELAHPELAADTHYEIELSDTPVPAVRVDQAPVRETRLPVVPDALHGLANIRRTSLRAGGRMWHHTRFHGLRSPVYAVLVTFWAAVGVFKVLGKVLHWWWVLEATGPRVDAARRRDGDDWRQLHNVTHKTFLHRGKWVAAGAGTAVAVSLYLTLWAPWWAGWTAVAAVVPLLARHGRPPDRRIIGSAVVAPRFRKLNSDIVVRASHGGETLLGQAGRRTTVRVHDGQGWRRLESPG